MTAQGWVEIRQDGIDWRTECGLCGWTLRGLADRAEAEREAHGHECEETS